MYYFCCLCDTTHKSQLVKEKYVREHKIEIMCVVFVVVTHVNET